MHDYNPVQPITEAHFTPRRVREKLFSPGMPWTLVPVPLATLRPVWDIVQRELAEGASIYR